MELVARLAFLAIILILLQIDAFSVLPHASSALQGLTALVVNLHQLSTMECVSTPTVHQVTTITPSTSA